MLSRHPLWTLDELGAQVALALAVDYPGQSNGRVREVPDRRTIRYYTTLGLIDRPAEFRGRTALYGPRHLLQLVAIKRLQARGLSLAEIQERLVGLTDQSLREVAQVPVAAVASEGDAETAGEDRRETAFWAAEPAPPAPAAAAEAEPGVRRLVAVPLAEGVTLLVEDGRTPDEHDLSALRTAAAPLLKLLTVRRIVGERSLPKGESP